MKNREEWARKGEAVTAEMVAKARDKDLARLERQASVRRPLVAEMKAAVASMRSPNTQADMFRQPSFRHLRTEPQSTETIAMPHHGFRRNPPRRGTPNRNVKQAVSIGTAERDALKRFRQTHPGQHSFSNRTVASAATAPATLGPNGSTAPSSTVSVGGTSDASSMGTDGNGSMHGSNGESVPLTKLGRPTTSTGGSTSMGIRKPERRGSHIL